MKNNNRKVVRRQPKKDSRTKRVNYDNTRESKFEKDIDQRDEQSKNPRSTKQTAKSNDVAWYANNAELLRAAASMPFTDVVGRPFDGKPELSVPGVLQMVWMPSIGWGPSAPLNQAANSIYSFTVHANSRNTRYNAVDEMLVILAGAQVFSAIALGIRAYGVMRRFSQLDRYTPSALVAAMGFDYEDLKSNLANMWFSLNELIARTQQIWIPNTMPVIARWFWLNSNLYMDADSAKSQYYVFTPGWFYMYNETKYETGGSLTPIPWMPQITSNNAATGLNTWSDYLDKVNQMVNALINSEDRGVIFGDILKAYGPDKLYALPPITADYVVEPVYDREVLSQIENCNVYTKILGTSGFNNGVGDIHQDNSVSWLVQEWDHVVLPSTAPTTLFNTGARILNFHQKEAPTPEQIMVATRLMHMGAMYYNNYKVGNVNYANVGPATCGTEVIGQINMFYNKMNSDNNTPELFLTRLQAIIADSGSTPPKADFMKWIAFDWAPWIDVVVPVAQTSLIDKGVGGQVAAEFCYGIGDYDMYTTIDIKDLAKMHTTAIYSEFGVPNI